MVTLSNINNFETAKAWAAQNRAELTYAEFSPLKAKFRFEVPKSAGIKDQKLGNGRKITTHNLTFWNTIDKVENDFSRIVLKTAYILLPVLSFGFPLFLIPFIDWAVGQVRDNREVRVECPYTQFQPQYV
jgi:hypothetical protein